MVTIYRTRKSCGAGAKTQRRCARSSGAGIVMAPMERASHMNQGGGSRATETSERAGSSRLRRLKLEGYKSFRNEDISFGDVTVLLGANGAGKSNLRAKIEFVRSNQNWREKDRSDYLFGPHQLSDGTLRFMALATLLLQPPEQLPNVIILDEPELGLHPFAISVLAGMVRSVATRVQVVLATREPSAIGRIRPTSPSGCKIIPWANCGRRTTSEGGLDGSRDRARGGADGHGRQSGGNPDRPRHHEREVPPLQRMVE